MPERLQLFFDRQLPTVQKQDQRALRLGITQGEYSAIVSGKRGLSETQIKKISGKLAPDDPAKCEQLRAELTEIALSNGAHGARNSSFKIAITDFFARASQKDALICCEYRDLPRANKGAAYERTAELAGEAIGKGGLHFAMFQPFGHFGKDTEAEKVHALEVNNYLRTLQEEVRRVYRHMRELAVEFGGKDAAERIVLYERNQKGFVGSGIQSRIFYAEFPAGYHWDYEVWEWVAVPTRETDVFLERDYTSVPPPVMRAQFFPIPQFLREEGRLPRSGDLNNAAKLCGLDHHAPRKYQAWSVYHDKGK